MQAEACWCMTRMTEMHGKRNRGQGNQSQGGCHHHHQEAKRSDEGPKGQRPEAKSLCAGCQGAAVEGVLAVPQPPWADLS